MMEHKACPFCGGIKMRVDQRAKGFSKYSWYASIACGVCGARGPTTHEMTAEWTAKNEAWRLWDERKR